jgi:hypothetical protein
MSYGDDCKSDFVGCAHWLDELVGGVDDGHGSRAQGSAPVALWA